MNDTIKYSPDGMVSWTVTAIEFERHWRCMVISPFRTATTGIEMLKDDTGQPRSFDSLEAGAEAGRQYVHAAGTGLRNKVESPTQGETFSAPATSKQVG